MLDFESCLNLMRKYGYSSTSVHPYIYRKGDKIGICYSYIDEQFGILERVKTFDSLEVFENFLSKLQWFKENGSKYNVRIVLDNYEIEEPKLMFLRNDKLMAKGEMFDIDGFDRRDAEKKQLDEVSRVIYEAGSILVVYDEIKNDLLSHYNELSNLKNKLRERYFELQKEVDYYNDVELERELVLNPVLSVKMNNEMLEYGVKDRYNTYKQNHPTLEEALALLKDCWELCSMLECDDLYAKINVEETEVRNDFRVVDAKIKYMKELNDQPKSFFKENLIKKFRSINKECKENSILIDPNYMKKKRESLEKKYSYYDALDTYSLGDYLKEAMEDTSYSDLAIKYAKVNNGEGRKVIKLPLNEVATNLLNQYNALSLEEQSILVLYNSSYRKIYDLILDIPDYSTKSVVDIVSILNKINGFSKIKSECYDLVKNKLDLPDNISIKNKIFDTINYDTFELFIESLVNHLKKIKLINNRMFVNSDLNMYYYISDLNNFDSKKYLLVTNNLNSEMSKIKSRNERVCVMRLKYGVPVLYAPYTIDFGDLHSKDGISKFEIKVYNSFELLIDKEDVYITRDENTTTVVKYFSEPKMVQDITLVDDIKMVGQTTFCKMSLFNNVTEQTQSQVSVKTETAYEADVNVNNVVSSGNTSSVVQHIQNNQQTVVVQEQSPSIIKSEQVAEAPVVQSANVVSQPVVENGDENNG